MSMIGRVYLVGAGPGDPGLITLRGAECLGRADVVLYDYLANPALLSHAPAAAERICVGKHGAGFLWRQDEINAQLIQLARQGKTVVRLKSGDPAIFARGAEELDALVRENIPLEVVPGITAALAAGSLTGIPLTHRDLASAVALVTGQEQDAKPESALDYGALAHFPGTLVIYMGVTTVATWSSALIGAGKSPQTPVAIIRRCSFADQQVTPTTLADVGPLVAERKLRPPAIFIVGEVVNLGPAFSWFEKRSLFGLRILVARPAHQANQLAAPLQELGAEVLFQPAIEIHPPRDWSAVDAALARLKEFDALVFSSVNGVRFFLERLLSGGRDLRALGDILHIAAIGPGTAAELEKYHLRADLPPTVFEAESLATALEPLARDKRFLLVRASRGRELLAERLALAGARVEQVVAYESRDVVQPDEKIVEQLAAGQIDWIAVTSSAIALSLVRLLGDALKKAKLASISPITSQTLRDSGHAVAAEAAEYTMAGVVAAILQANQASE